MYRRILVSLDGSVLPDQVVRTAAHLARRTGGTLLLLRAIQARRLSGEQEERDVAVADLGRVAAHADLAGVP
ncbi:MAG TPA: universal stress protein, partial [Ktedonobacterales bacterium]|nr:universal stress protein [Ktedonobacterales bacterium]